MGDADLAGEADRECGEETFIMEREERASEGDSEAVSWGGSEGRAIGLRDIEGRQAFVKGPGDCRVARWVRVLQERCLRPRIGQQRAGEMTTALTCSFAGAASSKITKLKIESPQNIGGP